MSHFNPIEHVKKSDMYIIPAIVSLHYQRLNTLVIFNRMFC